MKQFLILSITLLFSVNIFAQAPNKMSYQCVVRNSSNMLIVNTTVGIQVSILQGSLTGTAVYVETHTTMTDANGLASVDIGTGAALLNTFASINWANGPYFVKTETDPLGGNNYTISGVGELLSVPYALFSANGAGTVGPAGANGKTILNGIVAPTTEGVDGDFYVNTVTTELYGPKTQSGWGLPTSLVGATGQAGTNGTDGNDGINGIDGTNGIDGVNGKTILNGTTAPTFQGVEGDFYINTTTNQLHGPRGPISFPPSSVSLVGPAGAAGTNGTNGTNGKTILNGNTAPAGATGSVGDFYINNTTKQIYGPKTSFPTNPWLSPTSLIGPAGSFPSGTNVGDMQYWNGSSWVMVPVGTPGQFLQLSPSNKPYWSGGSYATLTTTALSSLANYATAFSGGNITNDGVTSFGGSAVIARGVCWEKASILGSANPTLVHNKTVNGSGMGQFTSQLTGLVASTTYKLRAYATNSAGTAYGATLTFTTVASTLPTLTTSAASLIVSGTSNSGGNISNEGGSPVTARGVCWSTSPNPTIALPTKTINGSGGGTFPSVINGLTLLSTTYYIRAYATNSSGLTGYGNQVTTSTPFIGANYQGGIVAYILQPGDPGYVVGQTHGLIAAASDQSGGIQWGSYTTTGATATAIGTGNANTNTIVSSQGAGSYAAKICYDLVLGGQSDWYLPSKDELNKLYLNKVAIGGFGSSYPYWSSSEHSSYIFAWYQGFNAGNQDYFAKAAAYAVRAVRSF